MKCMFCFDMKRTVLEWLHKPPTEDECSSIDKTKDVATETFRNRNISLLITNSQYKSLTRI